MQSGKDLLFEGQDDLAFANDRIGRNLRTFPEQKYTSAQFPTPFYRLLEISKYNKINDLGELLIAEP